MASRIPDPAIAELELDGRLLYRLEQRKKRDLSAVEAAAVVASLRQLAAAIEETTLDAPAIEILEDAGAEWTLFTDDPSTADE